MERTEIVQLFEELFENKPLKGRDIFIITDGVVSKREKALRLINANKESNRIFAFGVGEGNDAGFLEEIAEITNGKSSFLYETKDIQKTASELLDLSMAPVSIDNKICIEGETEIHTSPLLPNVVKHVFFRSQEKAKVSIRSEDQEEEVVRVMSLPFELNTKNPIFALLDHKRLISFDEIREEESIQLSLESGVLCKHTDYVDASSNDFQKKNCGFLVLDHIIREMSESRESMNRNLRLANALSGK